MLISLVLSATFLVGCTPPTSVNERAHSPEVAPTPRPTVSNAPRPSETPIAESPIARKYEELSKTGEPEKITEFFSGEELQLSAPSIFEHSIRFKNLWIYSDQPFDAEAGKAILAEVQRRLEASSLFVPEHHHKAFLCHDDWREALFLGGTGRIGGRNYYPMSHHVFLAEADVGRDALISPRGRPIAPPRTLTYYLAHEFTHTLMGETLGPDKWQTPPLWLFEGYPEVIGLGPDFNLEDAKEAYFGRPDIVRGTLAENYLRYGLMTSSLLMQQGKSIEELLENPPSEAEVRRRVGLK